MARDIAGLIGQFPFWDSFLHTECLWFGFKGLADPFGEMLLCQCDLGWSIDVCFFCPLDRISLYMGSFEENPILELHDESLACPGPIGKLMPPLNAAQGRWFHFAGMENFDGRSIGHNVLKSIKIALFSDKINFLIPFGPLAILVHRLTNHHGWVFFLSLVGMIPLAERISWMTEQLAFYTGPTVGGLLNATFGNATELIISIYAMKNGMLRVVQQSLLGSILSNLLLVLGCAFFAGGIANRNKEQVFNKANATMSCGLLLVAVMGLLFPTLLHFTHTEMHFEKSELSLSRFSSCVMLVAYCGYLFFQLTGQSNQYAPLDEEETPTVESWDDGEIPNISKLEIVIWLSILTIWISVLSEYLVNTIEGASVLMNIPIAFISVILLPIVGNAAEHVAAVIFAVKDKLDISLGVAIGSSTQISMFAIPFCVVVGWIMGHPLDLNFQPFGTATLFISVLVVASLLQEGTSNYFKGLLLVICYVIVAAGFFVHKS